MEIWKDVPDYEGLYKASNYGNVKRCEKICWRGKNYKTKVILPERQIKGSLVKGYWVIGLWKKGKVHNQAVHRIIAKTFIPNPENKPQIDHIDGNRLNNRVENLRWVTDKENVNNPITLKRKSVAAMGNYMKGRFGALHHNSKKVKCIETGSVFCGFAEASRKTGISAFGISLVANGKRQTAGGYHWQYV